MCWHCCAWSSSFPRWSRPRLPKRGRASLVCVLRPSPKLTGDARPQGTFVPWPPLRLVGAPPACAEERRACTLQDTRQGRRATKQGESMRVWCGLVNAVRKMSGGGSFFEAIGLVGLSMPCYRWPEGTCALKKEREGSKEADAAVARFSHEGAFHKASRTATSTRMQCHRGFITRIHCSLILAWVLEACQGF